MRLLHARVRLAYSGSSAYVEDYFPIFKKRNIEPIIRTAFVRGLRGLSQSNNAMTPAMESSQIPGERREVAASEACKNKAMVTIRLDQDVIDWFKAQGRGYQTRINEALRLSMMDQADGACPAGPTRVS